VGEGASEMSTTPLRDAGYAFLLLGAACSHNTPSSAPDPGSSPVDTGTSCDDFNLLKNVYWGDLHVHTDYSFHSWHYGNRNDPNDAYAFATGARLPIDSGNGVVDLHATIDRPLDFASVTDHSEFLQVTGECQLDHDRSSYCQTYNAQGSRGQQRQF